MKRLRQSLFNAARQSLRGGQGPGAGLGMRTRLLIIAAILGGAFLLIRPSLPTAVGVSYRLPQDVRALEVEYTQDGEVVRGARFHWAEGESPEVVRHEPELTPGPAHVSATWTGVDGRRRKLERDVDLDGHRVARVDLRSP